MKLTFFISRTKQIYQEKAILHLALFKFCLCQQLFANKDFCMKTRLGNIFKITNTKTLIMTILENAYKLLETSTLP